MRTVTPAFILLGLLLMPLNHRPAAAQEPAGLPDLALAAERVEAELVAEHGERIRPRLRQGLEQVLSFWRPEDGDAATFQDFVRTHFAADPDHRNAMFQRLEGTFEQLGGLMLEAVRQLRMHTDVEQGDVLPFDLLLAAYNPGAHLNADLFANRVAFVALLNFPLTTLE